MNIKTAARIICVAVCTVLLLSGTCITLSVGGYGSGGNNTVGIVASALAALFVVIFIIELISVLKISSYVPQTMLAAFFIIILIFLSPDMQTMFDGANDARSLLLFDIMGNISYCALNACIFVYIKKAQAPRDKALNIRIICVVLALCCAAYVPMAIIKLQTVIFFVELTVAVVYYMLLQVKVCRAEKDDLPFWSTSVIFFAAAGMRMTNVFYYSGITAGCTGWSSAYTAVCALCFIAIYLRFSIRTYGAAKRFSEYKLKAERLETQALIEQIKPHFIFNALMTVKAMYHRSVEDGDAALGLFCDYLRESLNMIDDADIPFDRELENVARFVDFINLNRTNKFNVIYDVDFTDFTLPAMSVQPFVENAVKYSRVNEREGGFIMITSYLDGDRPVLKISDNGEGFDPETAKKRGAHGLNNACERLKLSGAEVEIISAAGKGTEIVIKLAAREGMHEDNNS